jgi:hypothetical protein
LEEFDASPRRDSRRQPDSVAPSVTPLRARRYVLVDQELTTARIVACVSNRPFGESLR